MATSTEAGARRQYEEAIDGLLGTAGAERLRDRVIGDYPGRLAIQHRDVPHALLTDRADMGLIFHHLAGYWADVFPERLVAVGIPGAERWGQRILVARATRAQENEEPRAVEAEAFLQFLFEQAPAAYETGGFVAVDQFDFGEAVDLRERPPTESAVRGSIPALRAANLDAKATCPF
jgi:hypothetical protein